jgi:hypothetical protein
MQEARDIGRSRIERGEGLLHRPALSPGIQLPGKVWVWLIVLCTVP